jgi:hypothetical protein
VQSVELTEIQSTHIGRGNGGDPGPADAGEFFIEDFAATILIAPRGEVHDLIGLADRLQVGDFMTVVVADMT